ncbi:MAG: hypothetical protein QOI95_65 [Acidimicrobiaceae bacterium]|jgi:hypothetical protein
MFAVAACGSTRAGAPPGRLAGRWTVTIDQEEQVKSDEIMKILEAFDLTQSLRYAAELAGCSHHTVAGCDANFDDRQSRLRMIASHRV